MALETLFWGVSGTIVGTVRRDSLKDFTRLQGVNCPAAQSVGGSPSSSSASMRSHSVQLSMILPAAMRLRVIPVSDFGSDARLLASHLSEELLANHRSKTVSSTVLISSTLT